MENSLWLNLQTHEAMEPSNQKVQQFPHLQIIAQFGSTFTHNTHTHATADAHAHVEQGSAQMYGACLAR